MPYMEGEPPRSRGSRRGGLVLIALLAGAVIAGFGIGCLVLALSGGKTSAATPAATPTAPALASPTPASTASAAATVEPSPSSTAAPTAVPTPAPTPTTPALPAMLAAIGDSYSQAYSVSPNKLLDHPEYSWVVGTAKNDGVTSLLERFRALGGSPVVVDAATSGKKMVDAQRQADLVVAEAQNLEPGTTAYVTFELGTNDLCDDPKTGISDFTSQLSTAIETLQVNLPRGSRLLMVSVPDFRHFRAITQADPTAKAAFTLYKNSSRCAPFLGYASPVSIPDAEAILASYNDALRAACDRLNATTGARANLRCTYDEALLSDRDFAIGDLSTVDYFHPSLTGQAKMAAAAWKADVWANGLVGRSDTDLAATDTVAAPGILFLGPAFPFGAVSAIRDRRKRR